MIIDFRASAPIAADLPGRQPATLYGELYGRVTSAQQQSRPTSAAEFISLLDSEGIDRVVLPVEDNETVLGSKTNNETLAEFCAHDRSRLIGFAGADPLKGMTGVRELEHAVRELGLHGLNVGPFWQHLDPSDRRYYPLYAKCVELDVPVIVHASVNFSLESEMDHSHPRHIDRVATDFPELKIVATHGGWPWVTELVAVAWRRPNVYIDTAAQRPRYVGLPDTGWSTLVHFGNSVLQDRVLFASRWPLLPFAETIEELRQLPLKPAVLDKWLGLNAARLLKLDG